MTVQLRVRDDARTPTTSPRHRLDWDRDPELDRFAELSEHERVRVIIRVLCGLVALEEVGGGAATLAVDPAQPATPKHRRLLPFLGYERSATNETPETPATAPGTGLPFLGLDRPMGDTAHPWTRLST